MGSPQQGFYSTPLFELFRRGLLTQAVQRFHGINVYSTLTQLGPDWAQDLLNVIVGSNGQLSKMRLPIQISAAIQNVVNGPSSFYDFQQGNGTRQVLAQFQNSLYYFTNDLTVPTLIVAGVGIGGRWSFSTANNILFGANGKSMMKWTGANWWNWGLVAPNAAPTVVIVGGGLSPATGYSYGYAWKSSITGHVGNISPVSASTGAQAGKAFQPTAVIPPDPQGDTLVWFRNLDGGGDQFRLAEVNINTGAVTTFATGANVVAINFNLGITDNTPDAGLDQTTRGPLINTPPVTGLYTAVGQGRVVVFNLVGAPQDIIYSGLEQILIGRPEESFPPNNRLRLSIGAEQIAGGGVLQAGVVAFSQTGKMFMLRGQLEDITYSVPVAFSAYLEELPWTLGCASHFTIQATPYGLIWLAGDKTVQLFDGRSEPIDLSTPIYPYLRRITPGTESACVASYFNWLERDMYALLACLDGSLTFSHIFFFVANKGEQSNTIEDVEVFISDLPSHLPGCSWIGTITTSKLQRMLCLGAQGFIQQIPVQSDTTGGLTLDDTSIPATNGNLKAYWRPGYFGNDQPFRSKMFRRLRLISDQDGFQITTRLVDDENSTLAQPEILGPFKIVLGKLGLNRRAKRMSPEINFPDQDMSANVLELQVSSIPTSDR